jgi:hypothetical protein
MDDIATGVGQAFCNVAASLLSGQFFCHDALALTRIGYLLLIVAITLGFWLVVARPRLG